MSDPESVECYLNRDTSGRSNLQISSTEDLGRFLVASQDINAGDVVFVEENISWSPMLQTKPVCLACVQSVDGGFLCPKCRWPMCNKKCAVSPVHAKQECAVLSKWNIDTRKWQYDQVQPLYDVVTVLRTLALTEDKLKLYSLMQDHLNEWLASKEFVAKFQFVVDFLKEHKPSIREDDIWRVFAVSFTNDFTHTFSTGNQGRCMFPLTALANQSCFTNIFRTTTTTETGVQITVRASRKINKGEQVYNSYIDIIQPCTMRRSLLKQTKLMFCRCTRCLDPLDMGLNGNSVVCPFCRKPSCIPSPGDTPSTWQCEACAKTVPSEKVSAMLIAIGEKQTDLLSSNQPDKIQRFEKFLTDYSKKLSPSNMILVRVEYNLIGLYGRYPGYTQQEMTEKQWLRKIELCEKILAVLKVLEPAMTVRKGRILYELYHPLAMMGELMLQHGRDKKSTKKFFQRSLITLNLVIQIFLKEDVSSWEHRTALSLDQNRVQLQQIIKQL